MGWDFDTMSFFPGVLERSSVCEKCVPTMSY